MLEQPNSRSQTVLAHRPAMFLVERLDGSVVSFRRLDDALRFASSHVHSSIIVKAGNGELHSLSGYLAHQRKNHS